MTEDKVRELIKELRKISMILTAMEASGAYKKRARIHLSDKELREYMDSGKSQIYAAFVSNLVLQEIFAEELKDKAVMGRWVSATEQLINKMQQAGGIF